LNQKKKLRNRIKKKKKNKFKFYVKFVCNWTANELL